MISYAATTEEVTVTVRPLYLDDESDAVAQNFVFGYYVHIVNRGDDELQVVRSHMYIRDAHDRIHEEEQPPETKRRPVIPPGAFYEYGTSCVIRTFEGTLEGSVVLQRSNGYRFRAHVPLVALRALTN